MVQQNWSHNFNDTCNCDCQSADWWDTLTAGQHLAAILTTVIVSCTGILINFIILIMFIRHRLVSSTTNGLLLNLTIANFMYSAIGGSLLIIGLLQRQLWHLHGHCSVFSSIILGFGSVSLYTRTAIAVER